MDRAESEDVVAHVVMGTLRDLIGRPLFRRSRARAVHLSADLVRDLKVDSDDLSYIFVPTVQEQLHVRIPVDEWGKVYTVQDAIDLLKQYCAAQSPGTKDR
jgi:acyl carrier protein